MTNSPWKANGKIFFNAWRLGLIGVFALSILIYVPSLWGKPVWEDPLLISGQGTGGNTFLGAFTHPFLGSYYRPLSSVSFIVDRHFQDQTAYIYHQTNVLLHAATALLICFLTLRVTRKPLAGIFAGLFFAIQPAQIGAVAWVGGRTDVLSAFFIVSFITTLVLYYQSSRNGWWVLSVISFFLAVLSKEQSMALLLAVPISTFVFGDRNWRRAGWLTLPYAVSAAAMIALSRLPDKPFDGTTGQFDSIKAPFLTAADYAASFLVPTRGSQLTFSLHPLQGGFWVLFGVLALVAAVALGVFLWKRNRSLAWIYICGLLLYFPVSNFVPVPSFWVAPYRMAETGTCLACLTGAAAAFVFTSRKAVLGAVLAANLVAGGFVTWIGAHDWTYGPTLNQAVLQGDPHFYEARLYMIDELVFRKRNQEALNSCNELLTWLFGTPDWLHGTLSGDTKGLQSRLMSNLHENYGRPDVENVSRVLSRVSKVLTLLGRGHEAEQATYAGLCYVPRDADLNYEYGCEIVAKNQPEAIRRWEFVLKSEPDMAPAAAMLGHAKLKDGQFSEAEQLLAKAANEAPYWGAVWVELSDARVALHDYPGALQALDRASQGLQDQSMIDARRTSVKALQAHSTFATLR